MERHDEDGEARLEKLIAPTLHLNGTDKKVLADAYRRAGDALYEAQAILRECMPNGRDYYPQGPGALARAVVEHRARQQRIEEVIEELGHLYGRCL